MSERVLISYEKGTDISVIRAELVGAGAESVEPIEGLPETLLATVDAAAADTLVERAQQLAGVRNAERDRMRYSS